MDPSRTKNPAIRKFSPGTLQTDEEVIRQFVVRERELGIVLNILLNNSDSKSCQHMLVVAPRGRGKTMLLARVAAELRADNELSLRMLPVRFTEESHEVFNIADFWLETLFYLTKEIMHLNPDLARELQTVRADLIGQWRDRSLAERARATVLDASDRLGRKLVLMIENMQDLCDEVDNDFGWQLRETLQTEPQIMLLGTATSRFERLDDVREPFFELFRILDLKPLDTEACRRLWQVVSGDEVPERRIRPLQILTGGNPRLLVIVAEFGRHHSLRMLMEELVSLVDDHTEYFRGHLEGLAPTERRVYLAVIDLWQPSSTGEIAVRARMDVRSVSSLLGRLIDRGVVMTQGKDRKRLYTAAERLYSIYYKIRRERGEAAIVHYLIRFMAVFYSEDEIEGMSEMFRMEASRWSAIREGIERAKVDMPWIDRLFSEKASSEIEPVAPDHEATPSLKSQQGPDLEVEVVEKAMEEANQKVLDGDFDAAIVAFDTVIDQFTGQDTPRIRESVATALVLKGTLLSDMGQLSEALSTYTSVEERFRESEAPEITAILAEALVKKGTTQSELGRYKEAIVSFESVIKQFSCSEIEHLSVLAAIAYGNKGLTLDQSGKAEAAIEAYDDMIEQFGGSEWLGVKAQVAGAMHNKVVLQLRERENEAAVATAEMVVRRFSDYDMPQIQKVVASSLIQIGQAQAEVDSNTSAIHTYDEIVNRYGSVKDPDIQILVARALVDKGIVLGEMEKYEKAVGIFDEVVIRFGTLVDTRILEWVARALFNKGVAQRHLDLELVVTTNIEIVKRFGEHEENPLKEFVARALLSNGEAQYQLGDLESSIESYDGFIAIVADDIEMAQELQIPIASALISRGVAQWNLSRFSEALSSFDLVYKRFDSSKLEELQEIVVMSLVNKGMMQSYLGLTEEEISTYDTVIDRVGNSTDPELQIWCARAMINKGVAQDRQGNTDVSFRTYDLIVNSYGEGKSQELQQIVLRSMINKAIVQGQLGKNSESYTTYEAVIDRAGRYEGPWFREVVVKAWISLADIQIRNDQPEVALHTCETIQEMLDSLEVDTATDLGRQLQWINIRALLLQNDYTNALDIFRSVYGSAELEDDSMMQWMVWGVVSIIKTGALEKDVLDILLNDEKKAEILNPLVVALRKRMGLSVRASAEVNEVAEDISDAIDED